MHVEKKKRFIAPSGNREERKFWAGCVVLKKRGLRMDFNGTQDFTHGKTRSQTEGRRIGTIPRKRGKDTHIQC